MITNLSNLGVTIVAVAVFVLVFSNTMGMSTEVVENAIEICDAQHGEGEWVWVSANESEWDWTYIGDQKVCVDEDSQRATDHT